MNGLGFKLYLFFTISWHLHLASRIPLLGSLRIDLLLAMILIVMVFIIRFGKQRTEKNQIEGILKVLIIYVLVTFPISEWPGTVIKVGLPAFIKASVFYYFTVTFVDSEKRLKIFLLVYIACQALRVIEPLYLHIAHGYWGSAASMLGGLEFMYRLAGAPHDNVNPNGLAAVIFSIVPYIYFYTALSWKHKILALLLLPPMIYALVLTGSRSGIICFGIAVLGIIYKSKRKALLIPLVVVGSIFVFLNLSPDQQDRYLSILKPETKHGMTVHDRVTGLEDNFVLFMKRPVFGFGLGTAQEANYNYGTSALLPHNLYMDVGIQLGIIGVVIFIYFMKTIVTNFWTSYKIIRKKLDERTFLYQTCEAIQIILLVEVIFSFASYGLLIPSWYLLAGLSVSLTALSRNQLGNASVKGDGQL